MMIKIVGIVGLGAVSLLHPSIQNNGHCPRRCTLPETLPMFALEKLQSSILREMKKKSGLAEEKDLKKKVWT